MSLIRKNLLVFFVLTLSSLVPVKAEDLKKIGKFKDWQTLVFIEATGKVCFAESSPVLQAPKSNKRNARLFVTFRPNEKINDEISASPGYEFNKNNSVMAQSGKNKIKFDILEKEFAWIADKKIEKKMIKIMKKGSRIMITGYNQKGSQTIDHYSLLGFTKAYKAAKTACS
ncbi:invasion associated locus B family protein [Candidatus Pelagibacter sp.]|nr:invasion associated locus B family protein [Candidatus Pelagibacter sp.]